MVRKPTRRLILLRHAKSAWPDDVPDHDRPLAPRGRRDAPAAGGWLRKADYVPDRVLTNLIKNIHADPFFTTFPTTREEEAVGIIAG